MRKEGNRLVIEPRRKRTLIEFLDSLEPTDEILEIAEDLPPEPFDL